MSSLGKMSKRKLRILDFDIECRPIAWYAGEFVTKQPTVISWKFIGEKGQPSVRAIGESGINAVVLDEEAAMIEAFRAAYDQADVVTGHYIRGFDLTVLNGACIRLGLPGLMPKLSSDTKLDFAKSSGLSKSMENLSAMFEAKHPKFPMDTAKWARANMLLPDGIATAKKRCVSDVVEHIELRQLMLDRGLLGPPKEWNPQSSGIGNYHA